MTNIGSEFLVLQIKEEVSESTRWKNLKENSEDSELKVEQSNLHYIVKNEENCLEDNFQPIENCIINMKEEPRDEYSNIICKNGDTKCIDVVQPLLEVNIKEELCNEQVISDVTMNETVLSRDFLDVPSGSSGSKKQESTESGFDMNIEETTDDRLWKCKPSIIVCDLCGKIFTRKYSLIYHMMTHTGEKNHKCNKCGMLFTFKSSLTRHILRRHKEYKCNICAESFIFKFHLNEHMGAHIINPDEHSLSPQNGNKNHECIFCGKRFYCNKNLKEHLKTHTVRQKLCCEICSKWFATKQSISDHLLMHENVKKFICKFCKKQFYTKFLLKRHSMIHTNVEALTCNLCNKSFKRKDYVTDHLVKVHKVIRS